MKQVTEIRQTNALYALYGVLDTGNAMSRCHAIRAIERLKPHDAESGKRLIGLLNDPDPDVRTDTAAALGNLEIGDATGALLDTVRKDHEGDVRIQAVIALSKIKSRDAVEPLIECFVAEGYSELDYLSDDMEYSPCWEVQSQAMEALGRIGDHRATQPLIDVLESGQYEDLQERGFKVLARLSDVRTRAFLLRQLAHQSPRTRRRAVQGLGSLLDLNSEDQNPPREILDALANTLLDSDPAVRISAAQSLAGIDDAEVAAAVTVLIGDPDTEVRAAVATILGKTQGAGILERLHDLLEEPDLILRRSVVSILGQIGDCRSREALLQLLDSEDEGLLHEVLRSLGRIAALGAEPRIAEILCSQETHSAVRIQAAQALGNALRNAIPAVDNEENEVPEPRQLLAASVFDDDLQLASASLSALVDAYPDEAVAWLSDIVLGQPLILLHGEQTSDPEQEEEQVSLAVCDDPETSTLASIVIGLPEDRTAREDAPAGDRSDRQRIRVFAARLLGGMATTGSPGVAALIEAYQCGAEALCRETVLALGRIGDEAAMPVMFEALESAHPDVRLAALDVLTEIQMPAAGQERVAALCTDADPNLRCAAIAICALGSGTAAKDCVSRALADEDQQVCRTALNALTKDNCGSGSRERIVDSIFRFSGELRKEAGAALRRVGDQQGVSRLLEVLRDAEKEELHWLCIDALAEFFADATPATEA